MKSDEDYVIFDVLDEICPKLNVKPNQEYQIFVSKRYYDAQVMCGQETHDKTRHQIDIDINRSEVKIDGENISKFPDFLSLDMTRYCTQTCMALPVEILSQEGIVCELPKPSPLQVNVWGDGVYLRKKLRLLKFYSDKWIPITIILNVHENDPCILLKLRTHSYEKNSEKFHF